MIQPLALAKQSFLACFDWPLVKIVAPYYLVLVAIFDISTNPSVAFMGLFTGSLFTVLLIESLFAYDENSFFSLTNPKLILKKALQVFATGIVAGLFIFLGLICFVVPGIILMKRYLYALVLTVREELGPIEAMKQSRKLSESNGWLTIRSILYLSITFSVALLIIFSVLTGSVEVATDNKIFLLLNGWISQIGTCLILINGFKDANVLTISSEESE